MDISEPLATLDPAERPAAKAETPAPEAAWLANPAPDTPHPNVNDAYIDMLERSPRWNRPTPHRRP